MYLRYILSIFCVLFLSSCTTYLGNYKEIYYYKYNDIKQVSTYSIVLNHSIDSYSNFKYLELVEQIKNNLNSMGFVESKDIQQSKYLVYYDYVVLDEDKVLKILRKNNFYKVVLSVKVFDTKNTVDVFDKSKNRFYKTKKVLFDATSVLYTSNYKPAQSYNCLVNAIFKTQIMKDDKTIYIKSKISKEEVSIKTEEGIYYCLNYN